MVAICLAATACWIAFRYYTGIILEDALITWRYAEHLAQGAGFTFNPGERVLGTTTPILAVVLAAAALITGTSWLPTVAISLMIACGAATGWLVYRALRVAGFTHAVSLIAAATLLLHADIVWSTVGGMETPLVLLLMAATLYASITERYYLTAAGVAVMPFVRPDAVIWVMLILVHAAWYGRRRVVAPALIAALLMIAGAMVLTAYFGSPVPHSVVAKRTIGPGSAETLSWYQVQGWLNWIIGASGVNPFGGRIERVAIWPWLGLIGIGAMLVLRRSSTRVLWPLVAFPPALALAFLVTQAPHFLWYLIPYTACLCVLGGIGLAHLCEARWPAGRVHVRVAIFAVALLQIAAFAHAMRSTTDWHWRNQRNEREVRQAIGEWLNVHTRPDATVLMEAIGYQGTISGRRVIDLAGLISPRVVELQRQSRSNGDAFVRILKEFAPDYVVLRSIEVRENQHFHGGKLFESQRDADAFHAAYQAAVTYTAPHPEIWMTGSSVTVYSRR